MRWKHFCDKRRRSRIAGSCVRSNSAGAETNRLFQYAFTDEDDDEDWIDPDRIDVGAAGRLVFYGRNDDQSRTDFVDTISRRCELRAVANGPEDAINYTVSVCEPTLTNMEVNVQRVEPTRALEWLENSSSTVDDNRRCHGPDAAPSCHSHRHCHSNRPKRTTSKAARNKLIASCIICFAFMIAEIVGGYYANSLAIMTDAAHMLSDFASFLISLFALWLSLKAPTKNMPFGYYRAEVIGAVLSVLLIWSLTAILIYSAVLRVIDGHYVIDSDVMLLVSGIGVAVNIVMAVVLHGFCDGHNHPHGHTHGHPHDHGQATDNINVRAAFVHVLGDFVQSIGVMLAAVIIKFEPDYKLADPICTFLFSILVLLTTVNIIRDTLHVLMEGFPRALDYSALRNVLESVEGVRAAHDLRVWSLTMSRNAFVAHLVVDEGVDFQSILEKCETALMYKKYVFHHVTIQVEKYVPVSMDTCIDCQQPLIQC